MLKPRGGREWNSLHYGLLSHLFGGERYIRIHPYTYFQIMINYKSG
jgi:hypothetical protein